MWRNLLAAFKTLQDADIHFLIESFGPFGCPQHGHPSSYNFETIFAGYRVGLGNDYTTVPTAAPLRDVTPESAAGVYFALAHMAFGGMPLFTAGKRIDQVWTVAHKRALADYHAVLANLHRRAMEEDGLGVTWLDGSGRKTTLFNFSKRSVSLPGRVRDVSAGRVMPTAARYELEACHTYEILRQTSVDP